VLTNCAISNLTENLNPLRPHSEKPTSRDLEQRGMFFCKVEVAYGYLSNPEFIIRENQCAQVNRNVKHCQCA
jgi:hypothetical protein